tara:strand:- start:93 stop:497 length:405 start_codon:yes stop_codon:yes gene_type:complete
MSNTAKTKPRRGRKVGDGVGSGAGQRSLQRLRYEIHAGLGLLEDDGTPLSLIIKQQLQGARPEAMLGVLARLLPSDITVNAGSDFIRSLEEVGAAIDEQVTQAKAAELSRMSVNETECRNLPEPAEVLEKKDVN